MSNSFYLTEILYWRGIVILPLLIIVTQLGETLCHVWVWKAAYLQLEEFHVFVCVCVCVCCEPCRSADF